MHFVPWKIVNREGPIGEIDGGLGQYARTVDGKHPHHSHRGQKYGVVPIGRLAGCGLSKAQELNHEIWRASVRFSFSPFP